MKKLEKSFSSHKLEIKADDSKITKEYFEECLGYSPENDDLDRCNCKLEGEIGHTQCGWCFVHNKPKFVCGCRVKKGGE